jgi:hypothetical protein
MAFKKFCALKDTHGTANDRNFKIDNMKISSYD